MSKTLEQIVEDAGFLGSACMEAHEKGYEPKDCGELVTLAKDLYLSIKEFNKGE